uniref:ORF133 n=1 Tax=Spodoptera frugiperda granulovirus TaxID=307454 RepID=A0A346QW53_9BBAC|nr:ORF133 [Spodoptera frugiperda granulovirus]
MRYNIVNIMYALLFLVSLVTSLTYLSSYEAYINDGRGLCLGDCVRSRCVYKYNGALAPCTFTDNKPTYRFRTIDNEMCYSNCGFFNHESYQWCVVTVSNGYSWNYCNRYTALKAVETVRTDNSYMTCGYTTCGKHKRFSYNWCGTIGTYWEYCKPDNKALLIEYPTALYTKCASPCEIKSSDNVAYCYDENYTWTKCFLNPNFDYELQNLQVVLASQYKGGGTFTIHGYKTCDTFKLIRIPVHTTKRPRFKFYPYPGAPSGILRASRHYEFDVQHVANFYSDRNPTVTLQPHINFESYNFTSNITSPIVSYTVLPVPNYMYADQINLPLVVRAIVTRQTLREHTAVPRPFTEPVTRHIQHMHSNHSTDEPGFVVDYSLGGPIAPFNMFPLAWKHRSKRLSLESMISTFLKHDAELHVKLTAVLLYRMGDDNKLVHRPTAIMMRVRLYDQDQLVNVFGDRIRDVDNSMEKMQIRFAGTQLVD